MQIGENSMSNAALVFPRLNNIVAMATSVREKTSATAVRKLEWNINFKAANTQMKSGP